MFRTGTYLSHAFIRKHDTHAGSSGENWLETKGYGLEAAGGEVAGPPAFTLKPPSCGIGQECTGSRGRINSQKSLLFGCNNITRIEGDSRTFVVTTDEKIALTIREYLALPRPPVTSARKINAGTISLPSYIRRGGQPKTRVDRKPDTRILPLNVTKNVTVPARTPPSGTQFQPRMG